MTRKQLEANWGWSPTRGSLPFKRLRLTPNNIRDQKALARPGTLVHWAGKPCLRGRKGVDVKVDGNVTETALASHIANVNCLQCRKSYFRDGRRRSY